MDILETTIENMSNNTMLLLVDFLRDNDMDELAGFIRKYYQCWECKDTGEMLTQNDEIKECLCTLETNEF